jgi:adenosine deaminase/aminodeoxyfutalosine deaminase
VTRHLQTPEHYALITRRLLERLAGENVRYAEIIHSTGVVIWREQDPAAVYDAIRREAEGSGVEVQWIVDAVRQFGAEHVRRVAEFAASRATDGVVAFGIGGDEARGPARLFQETFRFAGAHGLRLTAHAGETTGPESIWEALEIGAERIGHGIRAIDDPVLVRHLRDQDIPLEVCLSSNVATGAVASLREHPIRRLFDAGVPITLNTDDPAMFHTTLSAEYELAAREFSFSEEELRSFAANAFRYSFRKTGAETTSLG